MQFGNSQLKGIRDPKSSKGMFSGGDESSMDATMVQNRGIDHMNKSSSKQRGTNDIQSNVLSDSAFDYFPDVTVPFDPWATQNQTIM